MKMPKPRLETIQNKYVNKLVDIFILYIFITTGIWGIWVNLLRTKAVKSVS